jgi:putative ABC transport system substrate-binding protein
MDRRAFLAGAAALLAAPLAAEAQPATKVYRVGVLSVGARPTPPSPFSPFQEELHERGWVEGKNLILEWRYADLKHERLPDLAGELVRLKVELIVTAGTPAAAAAKNATSTIPIVMMFAGDPVRSGLVANLARPGGNMTGLSMVASELYLKRLQILKEAIPQLKRVAVPYNPANPTFRSATEGTLGAIRSLGLETDQIEVRSPDNLEVAFRTAKLAGADAVVLISDSLFFAERTRMAELALQHRLPSIAEGKEFVKAGALMSYSPDLSALARRAAVFVDRILKGAKPGDLPIEQPTKFELVINLKTAKTLGLTIPRSLRLQADQVIE